MMKLLMKVKVIMKCENDSDSDNYVKVKNKEEIKNIELFR